MKKATVIIVGLAFAILLSLAVVSQLSPEAYSVSSVDEIAPGITLETKQDCTATFFNQTQNTYGSCMYFHNYTSCTNSSGPGTGCLGQQAIYSFTCKSGEQIVVANSTVCEPQEKFYIDVDGSDKILDNSDFGPCIQESVNDCLVITCVAWGDGAFKGQFTDCGFGKSCQKTVICEDGVKIYYKNAQEDFVEEDPTFMVEKMQVEEVGP